MAWHGYDPNIKAVENARRGQLNQPSNEYDPNRPFRPRRMLSPLALLGIALACAVIGLLFLLR